MHRVDLTSLIPVAEAHYTDLYGNAIKRFHEKYKDADPHIYYVNFNPVLGDPRDKTILGLQSDNRLDMRAKIEKNLEGKQVFYNSFKDLDSPLFKSPAAAHGDPVGTYGYPIDYVTKHWFDLTYGKDMTHLRVLKAVTTPDRVLKLTDMTRDYFLEVMKKLNLEFSVKGDGRYLTRLPNDAIMIYEAIFEEDAPSLAHFRVNSYGKVIFRLIQTDFTFKLNGPIDDSDLEDVPEEEVDDDNAGMPRGSGYLDRGTFKYEGYLRVDGEKEISAQKQNERARRAGFDAILDRAPSRLEAAIHPNEPEQIIFLAKRAYEVEDTFKLPSGSGGDNNGQSMPSREDEGKLIQKAAGEAAKAMGDRIAGLAWSRGGCPIKNLTMFRHWLATEKIEALPASEDDPTVLGAGARVDGWFTAKGRLIVVAPSTVGVHDVESTEPLGFHSDSVEKARIRPGENREVIGQKLDFEKNREQEAFHRSKLDHNALALDIGIVSEKPEPAYVQTNIDDTMDSIGKRLSVALAKSSRVVAPKGLSVDDLSAKKGFRHITATVINQYVSELKKRQSRMVPVDPNYAYKDELAKDERPVPPIPMI